MRPRNNLALFRAARARFSSISPAWSRWIAPGRIGFMSTQRRDGRSAATTETGRRRMRHGSRLAHCKDRANRSEQANAVLPTWVFPASASGQTAHLPAMAARGTLHDTRSDTRKQQPVRSFCPGSLPVRQATAYWPFLDRLIGYPPILPAVSALFHPTLPHVPAAFGCRTERYDGKGNLYLQHAT